MTSSIKVLFDIGHPAHFHLFKNFMLHFKQNNIPFVITTRDKEITNTLLDEYNFEYISLSTPKNSLIGMFRELIQRNLAIFKLHKKEYFTHAFGTSVSIAHLSLFTNVISYNFNEDDDSVVPLYTNITYPFTTKIIVPDCLKYKKWEKKRILHSSYHELAYLHPNNFNPDINLIKSYNLEPKKYIIVRLSALKAHHDTGAKGISQKLLDKIKVLLSNYTIIESHELKKEHQIKPWDMHHILAYAKMIICDSQTMAAETMVLGTPSIRINTFVGKISYLEELENKYNLGYGILPEKENHKIILDTVNYLATDITVDNLWQEKRQTMLKDKIDLNQWMIDFFEKEINKQ
ncbi:MAG: DUF354 domain-containing protein [bacterium]